MESQIRQVQTQEINLFLININKLLNKCIIENSVTLLKKRYLDKYVCVEHKFT